jgi:hypothetical protein
VPESWQVIFIVPPETLKTVSLITAKARAAPSVPTFEVVLISSSGFAAEPADCPPPPAKTMPAARNKTITNDNFLIQFSSLKDIYTGVKYAGFLTLELFGSFSF